MTIYGLLKHKLAFSLSHIITCFFLLFLDKTSCFVITEMSGKKVIFHKREKIKYSKRQNSHRNLRKTEEVILYLMYMRDFHLVLMAVLDTLTGKAAQKVLRLFSPVCIYRTKTQTMAIGFKREKKGAKNWFI